MVSGMYHRSGSQSDPTCILGFYGSSVTCFGRPAKKTLLRRSFYIRANEVVGFLFGKQGDGINFRPSPIIVVRDLGIDVVGLVRSCIATLEGRE